MKNSEIILYTTPAGHVKVEVLVREETVWLISKMMTGLFHTMKQNISLHLQNSKRIRRISASCNISG